MFTAVTTTVLSFSLPWARSNQLIPPKIRFNIIIPSISGSYNWSLYIISPHKNHCDLLSCSVRATWPTHLTILDLINLLISGEQFKTWCSPLCYFYLDLISFLKRIKEQPFKHLLLPISITSCSNNFKHISRNEHHSKIPKNGFLLSLSPSQMSLLTYYGTIQAKQLLVEGWQYQNYKI